jgi:ligand-binding sensor domain-containing protein
VRLLILLSLFTSTFTTLSQQYSFIRYGVKEGLAQSQVADISQDNLGYLWVGTQSGLSKFNGNEFINYSTEDGLTDNTIHKLLFSEKNNILYIATPTGITEYKNQKFTPHNFESSKRINDLIIYNDSLYIATNSGLLVYKNGLFIEYPTQFKIREIVSINDSVIFCATDKGLFTFNNLGFSIFRDSLINTLNYSGISIKDNYLILSTISAGILKYDIFTSSIYKFPSKFNDSRGIFVYNNEVWSLGNFGLVQIQEDSIITYYSENNGLPINNVKRLFKDRENNMWIGTYGKGLLKFSGKSIMSYTVKDGLSSDIVMSIDEAQNGDFIFGTYDKGVVSYSDENVKIISTKDGLNYNKVWVVKYDFNDICWIGTSRGVNSINNNKIEKDGIILGRIRSIFPANDSTLFFGGKYGLWCKTNNNYNHILSQEKYDIYKVVCNANKIYIATKSGLYWQYINQISSEFIKIELSEESCNTIEIDSYKNIWIGTIDGLYVISPDNNIIEYPLDESNFNAKNILGILQDSKNNIWLSTGNGIYLLNTGNPFNSELEKYHYSVAEGIPELESNLNALFEDTEGKIWVGTSTALIRINPNLNNKLFTYSKPLLSISSIKLFQEKFDYKNYSNSVDALTLIPNHLTFPHNKNHLTFNFIGINLKNPKNVKYSYRLLGAEDLWSPLSINKSATYSFISPGEYEFQLKATNDSINWTEVKKITVIISPPYWRTWWFVTFSLILLSAIIYFLFQMRIKSIEQKKDNEKLTYQNRLRDLEQQSLNASMNRHFIFNSLNSIQYFINSSDKLSANKYLSSFAKLIRKNLDSSTSDNFIVNLMEEIERIKLYLTLEKMRFGKKFNYAINVDSEIDLEMTNVPSMILQPFVENSIIHGVLPLDNGKSGHIDINIKLELNTIIFEVIDDGVGIDNSLKIKKTFSGDHESKGMMITANRIELLRKINGEKLMIIGPFQINDKQNNSLGTKVIIKLPIHED